MQHEDGRLKALLSDAERSLMAGMGSGAGVGSAGSTSGADAGEPPENAIQACVDFCERWDLKSNDPSYPSMPLEQFEPMMRRVFSHTPYAMGQTHGVRSGHE